MQLDKILFNGLSPLDIFFSRFGKSGHYEGFALVLPSGSAYENLRQQASAYRISVYEFDSDKVIEKPLSLKQQRWQLEDDSGNDTWVGAAIFAAISGQNWDTAVLLPLANLLVEPEAVYQSLILHRREAFDICHASERVPGAGWTIFQTDLIKGLMASHDELMWVRGGLAWAVHKPLYPFKIGFFHCPRVRPAIRADLRLNSRRALRVYEQSFSDEFAAPSFSYEKWLQSSDWETSYTSFAPLRLEIETSSRCEAACFNCGHNSLQRAKCDLSPKSFAKLLAELAEHRETMLVYSGIGEPMQNNDIENMIANGSNFNSMLITSLQTLPGNSFPWSALDQLRISIDSLEGESFGKLRKGCNWSHIEDFINNLKRLRAACDNIFPEVGVTFLAHGLNEGRQQSFLNYWKQVCKPVFRENFFRWPFTFSTEPVQWYQILGESSLLSEKGQTAKIDFAPVKRRPCHHALLSPFLLADGRVTICKFDIEGSYSMGNIADQSFAEIWNSQAYRQFRAKHVQLDFLPDYPCAACKDWYHLE